jgi:DNA-binding CsgD family transcriptional regulator
MAVQVRAGRLLGRERERGVLERVLGTADDGHGAVLVVHGDPGVGKTALLDDAARAGEMFCVVRTAGVEGEMALDFSALQHLCGPLLEDMDRLPDPQRSSLGVAFGLHAGPAPSPFLVGLGVLGLLSEAAEERPLLCLVDDAQWLDPASGQVLAFVARRLLAERIALVFATRRVEPSLARLPELRVGPLGRRDARALLESVLPARLDEPVLDRIVAETRGNPLALLEMPHGLTPAQLAGGFGLPAASPLSSGIEQSFARRLTKLPREARRFLLLAAAEPVGDPALLRRAAEVLGISEAAADRVMAEGLLSLDGAVVFRHPLVRSAIYGGADPGARREAHRALADATDSELDPDRRAWHRGQSVSAPDEEIAAELERSAVRAQARGGFAAAAAFLERASALTPDPDRRAERALIAAQSKFQAGALEDALALLATAGPAVAGALGQAAAERLRARIAFVSTHGREAAPRLLEAAGRLETLDPRLAGETYLEALSAAMFAGRLAAPGGSTFDVAQAAKAASLPHTGHAAELLLDGLAALFNETYSAAVPILRQAEAAFDAGSLPANEQLRWKWLATVTALHLWDDGRWEAISERHIQLAREAGALSELPLALSQRAYAHVFAGELSAAESLNEEIRSVVYGTGSTLGPYVVGALAAFRGDEAETLALVESSGPKLEGRGEGFGLSALDWAEAVLYNGLGRYNEAYAAARRVVDHPEDLATSNWGMAELIEAAVRCGARDLAVEVEPRLTEMTAASGTDWALGIAARSRALLADDDDAADLYIEAIERLGRSRMRVDLARAHLLHGEWLRRQRNRLEARAELRVAHEFFADAGLRAFAERARVELEATGEHARKRTVETLGELTPQEAQISHLVSQGQTNREIAAQLFLSPSTVEYHLRKVFRKLGVKSRTQLAGRLRQRSSLQ